MSSWKDSWNASAIPQVKVAGNGERPYVAAQPLQCNAPTSNPWTTCFKKYATFSGRARRKEYWCFVLINNLVCGIIMFIAGICAANFSRAGEYQQKDMEAFMALGIIACLIYGLTVALPTLAVTVRRLHDTGRSGWFMLIQLIPIVGPIVFFITMLLDSQPGANAYGSNPKGAERLGMI